MPTVLCFGDSNTWGYVPGSNGSRFPREVRWPARLQHALGGAWEVIAEGLSGRTATMDSPVAEGRNGLPYLVPCLHSHAPLDLVICPPPFDGHRLGPHFAEVCSDLRCDLLDLDGVAAYATVGEDVEHLDADAHAAVAASVEAWARQACP